MIEDPGCDGSDPTRRDSPAPIDVPLFLDDGGVGVVTVYVAGSDEDTNPVLCMIDPSLRDKIRVDWMPGRDVRCDNNAVICWGIGCCLTVLLAIVTCSPLIQQHVQLFEIASGDCYERV